MFGIYLFGQYTVVLSMPPVLPVNEHCNKVYLEQVRVQHQPCDSHFGSFLHLGPNYSAYDPFGMD